MSYQVSRALAVNVPTNKIWRALDDYSSIDKYAPTVKSSAQEGELVTGVGARRRVTFVHDSSSVVEEITEYTPEQGYKMKVTEVAAPLKTMNAEINVSAIDENSSVIEMTVNFEVKGGLFGWIMANLLMKPMMNGVVQKILTGLAYHAATGQIVENRLPNKPELANILK